MKRGFTLVELSIVLVIIGLLIGGILVGQSLIQSASINALVRQTSQFDIATTQFKVKFKSTPGDSRLMPSPGDGDGLLEDNYLNASATNLFATDFNFEISNFWHHLSITGFKPDKVIYSNNASTGIKAKINIPQAAFGRGDVGAASFLAYNDRDENAYYWIADWNKTTNTQFNGNIAIFSYAYTPLEAMAIDSKLDNGIQDANGIVSTWHPDTPLKCYSGSEYLVSHPEKECFVFIQIATDTGDLKN